MSRKNTWEPSQTDLVLCTRLFLQLSCTFVNVRLLSTQLSLRLCSGIAPGCWGSSGENDIYRAPCFFSGQFRLAHCLAICGCLERRHRRTGALWMALTLYNLSGRLMRLPHESSERDSSMTWWWNCFPRGSPTPGSWTWCGRGKYRWVLMLFSPENLVIVVA